MERRRWLRGLMGRHCARVGSVVGCSGVGAELPASGCVAKGVSTLFVGEG